MDRYLQIMQKQTQWDLDAEPTIGKPKKKKSKVKDAIIIFVLFFLMSQDMIKELFSQYFTSINPDESGKVGAKGVIIYGIICLKQ